MKLKQTALLVMGLLPLGVIAQPNNPQAPVPPSNLHVTPPTQIAPEMPEKGKLSYAVGMYFGGYITNNIKRGDVAVDNDAVLQAIGDVVNGKPTKLTPTEFNDVMNQLRAAITAKRKREEEEAKTKGEAFLIDFAKSPGVTTLSNGLEYKVIKAGDGPMPKDSDTAVVNYRGTFVDGKEFDRHDNFPAPLRGRIIQGWQKILPLMKVGSKWQVAIPSVLGYGPRGYPPNIPPNTVLVFDLELVSIKEAAPTLPPIVGAPPGTPTPNAQPAAPTPVVSGEIIKVPSADELKKGAKIEVIKAGQTNAINSQ